MELLADGAWLPTVFMVLMGVAVFAYVVLDGYDLGVGILMRNANEQERDMMIASIGPFWDANETWLVLGVGILLVALPVAHGIILGALYLPVAAMLGGLILRGVAFDFRAKAKVAQKHLWDRIFILGSMIATFAQGYMLGLYIVKFERNFAGLAFAGLSGIGLVAGYSFLGACWLILKAEGTLQKKAVVWARQCLWSTAAGMAMISLASPIVSERIFNKWFSFPNIFMLLPIPMMAGAIILALNLLLRKLPHPKDHYAWVPFIGGVLLFFLGFNGLAYSFYPYIVPEQMTIWEAASAPESLFVMLIGVIVVLPCIITYTIFAYRIFNGKVKKLEYY